MMNLQTWRSVLIDLWYFVWGEKPASILQLPNNPVSLEQNEMIVSDAKTKTTITTPTPAPLVAPAAPDERYILVSKAAVSITPYLGFDTVFTSMQFAEAVTVRAYQGEYAQIVTAHGLGWIHKDVLESKRSNVWPTLIADVSYPADSVVTQLIRRHLDDSFGATSLQLPLQSVEYVSYRLKQIKHRINWGVDRPRLPGLWQDQLKGRAGIHIGIQPLADSVMEFRADDGDGVLFFVEAVAPDNTLTCSTVGLKEGGVYTTHIFEEADWREWRPVFIDVTS